MRKHYLTITFLITALLPACRENPVRILSSVLSATVVSPNNDGQFDISLATITYQIDLPSRAELVGLVSTKLYLNVAGAPERYEIPIAHLQVNSPAVIQIPLNFGAFPDGTYAIEATAQVQFHSPNNRLLQSLTSDLFEIGNITVDTAPPSISSLYQNGAWISPSALEFALFDPVGISSWSVLFGGIEDVTSYFTLDESLVIKPNSTFEIPTGTSLEFTVTAADSVANVATENFYYLVDSVPPTVQLVNPADAGSYFTPVHSELRCKDDESGIGTVTTSLNEITNSVACGETLTFESGGALVVSVEDKAGNRVTLSRTFEILDLVGFVRKVNSPSRGEAAVGMAYAYANDAIPDFMMTEVALLNGNYNMGIEFVMKAAAMDTTHPTVFIPFLEKVLADPMVVTPLRSRSLAVMGSIYERDPTPELKAIIIQGLDNQSEIIRAGALDGIANSRSFDFLPDLTRYNNQGENWIFDRPKEGMALIGALFTLVANAPVADTGPTEPEVPDASELSTQSLGSSALDEPIQLMSFGADCADCSSFSTISMNEENGAGEETAEAPVFESLIRKPNEAALVPISIDLSTFATVLTMSTAYIEAGLRLRDNIPGELR